MSVEVLFATDKHVGYAEEITIAMAVAAKERGTGIAKRSPEYVMSKMTEGKAVIALDNKKFAGFCYIETWGHGKYVANSGLIVLPEYRKSGLARKIKEKIFELSRTKFPESKIFGITTSLAVMKINSELGYKPVTFSELTTDETFWKGCQSCTNYDILTRTNRSLCLCTGMIYDPEKEKTKAKNERKSLAEKWTQFKEFMFSRKAKKQELLKDEDKKESSYNTNSVLVK
ncbi:GNAT family N-acetyltransferase [Chondrinema litorale]|uniref:GNAT family N-acetyltransferase n=1 Tax=Chondrinema litorale TaxID=2994555 RepID=UPI0025438BA1|nr:GNAT family N-acetyltransferase [Chondrinema litorale]UZR94042.1 GNAT family N-acetyltransferase [Chondrinema litorale]